MATAKEDRAARQLPSDQVNAPAAVVVARTRSDRAIRYLNVVVATVGLIVTFPLWILIAIVVKATSRGPVFYTQTRVGLDRRGWVTPLDLSRRRDDVGGLPFTIVKFRTMRVDAEEEGKAVWAQSEDDRVTLVGSFLRSCRLDELPQLLNVLLAWLILIAEPVLAALILSGWKARMAWTLTSLLMFLLTIGQTILMKPDVIANWQFLVLVLLTAALRAR